MKDRVVHFLKEHENYISGEELSRKLNVTRAGIWKYMQELRDDGYDIVAVPHLGYKLVSAPDKLYPAEIQWQLKTREIGRQIVFYENISSTMDEAFSLGLKKAAHGTVVFADGQQKGRGRLGRSWLSPKGKGIYLSLLIRPALAPSLVPQLTLLSAVAVAEAVQNTSGLLPQIKWPNDILINHKKAAGILTEMNAEQDRVHFVVIGIGLNVNTSESYFPSGATSLKVEAGRALSRVELAQELLRCWELWYERLARQGFPVILKRWKDFSVTLGRRIRISDPAGDIEGEAFDLDSDGALLIRQSSGVVVRKMSGDVMLLRK